MMKSILPLIMIIWFNNINITIMVMLFLIIMVLLNYTQFTSLFLMSQLFMLDNISILMIILSFMSVVLIYISSYNLNSINTMITLILLLLIPTFSSSNMILFYILFEITLIPTLMIITKSGTQPERLQAGIYMLMYTIFASLPLLLSIINIKLNSNMMYSFYSSFNINYPMIFMLAFLVKLPMFLFHLWLPKAHVEAPVEGSMILAAILLKLGGYGLMRFFPLMINSIVKFNYWLISLSMIGATATSLNCIRQKDLKSLIAYSSVSHMGFILSSMLTLNYMGMMGAFIMMIAHGFSSSALFLLVNMIYSKYHTRNIISFKGLINSFPNLMFWWFIFMAINISAPPSINMMSEVMMMSSLLQWNSSMLLMIFILSLSTASFSIFMFINISHNMSEMLPSNQSLSKMFLSLMIHLIPLLLIIMKLEMMM
uniref:NADH dehydrogenase subunit 4 n=1 Tax=Parasteatoda cingulata TaxID=2905676 RepID=UPI0022385610|nr:NADH dehydrogenase subunit 4 [Parasteatoda cingulata]UYG23921.1 NADH dehydrogenase subunit 4 [Parasteatoda cingulata]